MATDRAKAIMQAMVEMFATGDLAALTSTVAPNYLDHQGLGGQVIHGVEGFAQVVHVARLGYVSLEVSIEDLIAEGNRAVARIRWQGTRTTGEQVDRETIDIIRVADGRATEHWGAHSSLEDG